MTRSGQAGFGGRTGWWLTGYGVRAAIEAADPESPPTLEELVTYAKSRLAPYKVPKTIELVGAIRRRMTQGIGSGKGGFRCIG